jgi:urea transporter
VPISIAALAGVQASDAGLASGLFNTSQQIGGALGIAALSAIATSTTEDGVASGTALPQALTDGFENAFIWGGIIAAVGILVGLVLVRQSDLEAPVEEVPEPLLEAA